jgi:predicted GNAT family acetyltransferase
MEHEIKFESNQNRFYISNNNNETIAEVTFKPVNENTIILYHTFVDISLRGQGIAKILVDKVVDYARLNNLKIKPTCSYALKIMTHSSSYQDVLIN